MPNAVVHVTRADVITGEIPPQAAAINRNNAPMLIVGDGSGSTLYQPVQSLSGAFHPDEPAHPWSELPRDGRIAYGIADEYLNELIASGVERSEALAMVGERFHRQTFDSIVAEYRQAA